MTNPKPHETTTCYVDDIFMLQKSKRNNNKGRQSNKRRFEQFHQDVCNKIQRTLSSKDQSPHCLIELTKKEYKFYKDNSILLLGLRRKVDPKTKITLTLYDNIKFGKSIRLHMEEVTESSMGERSIRKLDIARTKSRYIFMLARCAECITVYKQTHVFS